MVSLNDVLLAYSNIPVDDPIAEIWGRGLQDGYEIIEYTGALPITITADGSTLIDYCIYGNTVQNGTPTPDNPIMPEGVCERTENLFDISTWYGVTVKRGIIEEVKNGFRITALTDDAYTLTYGNDAPQCAYKVTPNEKYTLSWRVDNPNIYGIVYVFSGYKVGDYILTSVVASQQKVSFTVPSNHNYIAFRLGVSSSGNSIAYTDIMLNLGSTALPYEPYGYKLPMTVSDGNTVQTVPVYLGEAATTRRIKKLVLTGEEMWAERSANYYSRLPSDGRPYSNALCTHSQNATSIDNNGNYLYLRKSTFVFETLTDFESYLAAQYAAGTPVTIWYVLAEPETGIVNEPLMKIGDYADTLSMEQADVSIPTFAGTTVIDYNGTPKPSGMYVKYRR